MFEGICGFEWGMIEYYRRLRRNSFSIFFLFLIEIFLNQNLRRNIFRKFSCLDYHCCCSCWNSINCNIYCCMLYLQKM